MYRAGKETANLFGDVRAGAKSVIQHVGELHAQVADAITSIKKSYDPKDRELISRELYELVLEVPRGYEGYRRLFALDQDMREAKDVRHCAPWLARLLVLADHVCERAGGDGLAAGILVAEMQGWIEHFMAENGVRGWGVSIIHANEFDKLRVSRPKAQHVDLTPLSESGARGEALMVVARALGLETGKWSEQSLLAACATISSSILEKSLKEIGKEVSSLGAKERVSAAIGLWSATDAVCQHASIKDWEIVPILAHTQLFLDYAKAEKAPQTTGAALGIEARIYANTYNDLRKSSKGKSVVLVIGQCAKDFCRTGDVRYLPMLASSAMNLAPFVQISRSNAVVVFE